MSDLDQELGMATIVDLLASIPSSQPSSQSASQLDTSGPKTLPHYTDMPLSLPVSIPMFNLAKLKMPPTTDSVLLGKDTCASLVTEQDNALLRLTPKSPMQGARPFSHVIGRRVSGRGLGHGSYEGSPMSVGSPVGLGRHATLTKALMSLGHRPPTPHIT